MRRSWGYSYLLSSVVYRPCARRALSHLTVLPSQFFTNLHRVLHSRSTRLHFHQQTRRLLLSRLPLGLSLSRCVRMALLFGVTWSLLLVLSTNCGFRVCVELLMLKAVWGKCISAACFGKAACVSDYYPWDARACFLKAGAFYNPTGLASLSALKRRF